MGEEKITQAPICGTPPGSRTGGARAGVRDEEGPSRGPGQVAGALRSRRSWRHRHVGARANSHYARGMDVSTHACSHSILSLHIIRSSHYFSPDVCCEHRQHMVRAVCYLSLFLPFSRSSFQSVVCIFAQVVSSRGCRVSPDRTAGCS